MFLRMILRLGMQFIFDIYQKKDVLLFKHVIIFMLFSFFSVKLRLMEMMMTADEQRSFIFN